MSAIDGKDELDSSSVAESGSLKRNALAANLDVDSERDESISNKRATSSYPTPVSIESASLVLLDQHLAEAIAVQAVVQSALQATNDLVAKLRSDKKRMIELESNQAVIRERERRAWREEKVSMQAELSRLLAQHTTLQSTHVLISKAYAESEANAAVNMNQIAYLRNALNARRTPSPAPPGSPLSPPSSDIAQYQPSSSALEAPPKHENKVPVEVDIPLLSNDPPIASTFSSQGAQGIACIRKPDLNDVQLNPRTPSVPPINIEMNPVQTHPQPEVPISETPSSVGVVIQSLTKSPMDTLATPTTLPRPHATPSTVPLPPSPSPLVQTYIEGSNMNTDFILQGKDLVRPKVINRLCRVPEASTIVGDTSVPHRPPYFLVRLLDSEVPHYARYLSKTDNKRTTHLEVRPLVNAGNLDSQLPQWVLTEAVALRPIPVVAQCSEVCVYLDTSSKLCGYLCRVSLVKHESRQVSVSVLNRSPKVTIPFLPTGHFALAHVPGVGES